MSIGAGKGGGFADPARHGRDQRERQARADFGTHSSQAGFQADFEARTTQHAVMS
jgi:hypothetical protein